MRRQFATSTSCGNFAAALTISSAPAKAAACMSRRLADVPYPWKRVILALDDQASPTLFGDAVADGHGRDIRISKLTTEQAFSQP